MLTHILAILPTELPSRSVATCAVSVASAFKATLDVVAVGFERTRMPLVAGGSVAMASAYESESQKAIERAKSAISLVEAEAIRSEVACRYRALSLQPESAAETLCAQARMHDLTILAQPDDSLSSADSFVGRKVLFEAGGPVLFIPSTFGEQLTVRRIGICWDGSRLAARALHDAMPFLLKADMIGIINVEVGGPGSAEASPLKLQEYLTEMGLSCQVMNLASERSRVVPAILSLSGDESMDLLVMGAYSHARLIESAFGGATFKMLRQMSIPTLMSH